MSDVPTGSATAEPGDIPRLVEAKRPALTVLDLLLPGVDGIDLMRPRRGSPAELAAWVALEQRRQFPPAPFRIGDLVLDRSRRRVTLAGRPVRLTATE